MTSYTARLPVTAALWRARAAFLLVLSASLAFALVAAYFAVSKHDVYRSGFDLANLDQELWLLSRGYEPMDTQTGQLFWGVHFSPALALLTPLFYFGGGPEELVTLQALALAAVSPLLYALARAYGASRWLAAIPALLWLASPLTWIPAVSDVHHVPLAAPLVVGSILALKRERLIVFAVLGVLACCLKEDIPLLYAALGVVVALEGRRRLGAAIGAAAIAIFLFAVAVFLPAFSDSQSWFAKRFAGDRGDSLGDVAVWMLSNPLAAVGDLVTRENAALLLALLVATGGLCLLAPRWMLLGVPALAHNLLSAYGPQHGIWNQYHVPVALALTIAAAVGVHRLAAAGPRVRLLAAAGVTAGIAVLPLGVVHAERAAAWDSDRTARFGPLEARRTARALIPDDVPVAASTPFAPHLTHRREMYTLPLPFLGRVEVGTDWSREEMERRAGGVRWVVFDSSDVPTAFPQTRERIGALLPRLGFRRIYAEGTVSVWRR
jgi:uncharacterized membrane protein